MTEEPKLKKVFMQITLDQNNNLEWEFNPDLNIFYMYAVYGLLGLIREELKDDLRDSFQKV